MAGSSQVEIEAETSTPMTSLAGRQSFYNEANTSASTITINEVDANSNWKIPPIMPSQVYNMPLYKYYAKTQIRQNSVDLSFTSQDNPIQIPLLEKSKGFKYCHLGAIRFGLNPLV